MDDVSNVCTQADGWLRIVEDADFDTPLTAALDQKHRGEAVSPERCDQFMGLYVRCGKALIQANAVILQCPHMRDRFIAAKKKMRMFRADYFWCERQKNNSDQNLNGLENMPAWVRRR